MPTSVVTGANRGIGLELVRELSAAGGRVIATCRTRSPELDALGVEVHEGVDVGDTASVNRFAASLGDVTVDLLICNAGILSIESLEDFDEAAIRRQFDVNAIGPLRVARALLPSFAKGGKIALITSRMGSISDNSSGGAYGYRMSKAALNVAGVSLAKDVQERGISVAILHPGMVATDMTARFGHSPNMQAPAETASMLLARVGELTLETSGRFVHANGEALPW